MCLKLLLLWSDNSILVMQLTSFFKKMYAELVKGKYHDVWDLLQIFYQICITDDAEVASRQLI